MQIFVDFTNKDHCIVFDTLYSKKSSEYISEGCRNITYDIDSGKIVAKTMLHDRLELLSAITDYNFNLLQNKVQEIEQNITISLKEYEQLCDDELMLNALEGAGVDNWEGYEYAIESYNNSKEQ